MHPFPLNCESIATYAMYVCPQPRNPIAISIRGYDNCGFDDDSAQFRMAARTIAVLTTIQRNFDRRLGQLRFRRRFSTILIGGEDNCGFDDDSAQFRLAAGTISISTTIQRNFDWRRGQVRFW